MSIVDVVLWMAVAAVFVPAHRRAWEKGDAAVAAVLALDVVVTALVVVASSSRGQWARLAREDGPIEWATFAAFAAAAAVHCTRLPSGAVVERLVRAAIGLFCVFVAGEEVSWGQRLFAFRPPDAFLEHNFQQELNVHNVLMDETASGLGFAFESKHLVVVVALAFAVLLPALVRTRLFAPASALAPSLAFLPAALAITAAELTYPVDLTGEAAEMVLGLLLLACAVVERAPSRSPSRVVVAPLAAALAAGALLAPLTARLVFGDDAAGRAVAAAELALLRDDVVAGARDKLRKKSSVHKRLFTAARDGYVTLDGGAFLEGKKTPAQGGAGDADADARRDRRGYFLDPWNDPYWLLVDNKRHRAALYSFGPNRQRDTDVRHRDAAGDDVLVHFELFADASPDQPDQPGKADGADGDVSTPP